MGSVSNYFTDFENKSQVVEWRNLVYLTAQRYIGECPLKLLLFDESGFDLEPFLHRFLFSHIKVNVKFHSPVEL